MTTKKLSLWYITGNKCTTMRRPGAYSNARWMCKILYSLKIVMLSKVVQQKLPVNSIFTEEQLPNIIRFANFCVLVYVKWWVTCIFSETAPRTDLCLISDMKTYKEQDEKLASAGLKAFGRHLWYLNGRLLPLCLFDEKLGKDEKQRVAVKIHQQQNQVMFFSQLNLLHHYLLFYY